uniref:Alpha/beta hydrolase fold-3 domain-containing protein n=1 Tax=Sarcophilus harrisii TaxID=9305 RepID=A0A7N4NHJ4_SARHA
PLPNFLTYVISDSLFSLPMLVPNPVISIFLTSLVSYSMCLTNKYLLLSFLFSVQQGNILEKLYICSMPKFLRFLHDCFLDKKDPHLVVTTLHFGKVPVRLYKPKAPSAKPRCGIIFFHGGACIFGSLKFYNHLCCYLSRESDSVVLSVGYRMVPDHKYPAPLNDCITATIHFLRTLDTYGVDPSRVILCGDSAGGSSATSICQMLVTQPDLPKIRAQILIYPYIQGFNFQLPSHQQNKNIPLLTLSDLGLYLCFYFDMDPSWTSIFMQNAHRFKESKMLLQPTNSPLIADDDIIAQLPETLLVSCEFDILRDDALLYKKRLEDLGVPVSWHHIEDGFHGVLFTFGQKVFYFPCSLKILNIIILFIKEL